MRRRNRVYLETAAAFGDISAVRSCHTVSHEVKKVPTVEATVLYRLHAFLYSCCVVPGCSTFSLQLHTFTDFTAALIVVLATDGPRSFIKVDSMIEVSALNILIAFSVWPGACVKLIPSSSK